MEPPSASADPARDPLDRKGRRAACLLLLVLFGLVGTRWYLDRHVTRPSTHIRDAGQQVDLNRASRDELMQIPGIGPRMAERIVAHRESNGRFSSVDELDRVPGIGETTLGKLRIWVKVDAAGPSDAPIVPDRLSRKPTGPSASGLPATAATLDINQASLEEIQKLPGIGPVLARRIVEERERKPFSNVEDLRRVPGIGPKRIDALRTLLVFRE